MSGSNDNPTDPSEHDDQPLRTDAAGPPVVHEQRLYESESGADLSTVIIEAVAAAEGVEPTAIKDLVLYEAVDIASVKDALFGVDQHDGREMTDVDVSFNYRGFRVTIRSDGWVQVADQPEG